MTATATRMSILKMISDQFEAFFPGLDGIHNVLWGRAEQALILHQGNCRIKNRRIARIKQMASMKVSII